MTTNSLLQLLLCIYFPFPYPYHCIYCCSFVWDYYFIKTNFMFDWPIICEGLHTYVRTYCGDEPYCHVQMHFYIFVLLNLFETFRTTVRSIFLTNFHSEHSFILFVCCSYLDDSNLSCLLCCVQCQICFQFFGDECHIFLPQLRINVSAVYFFL